MRNLDNWTLGNGKCETGNGDMENWNTENREFGNGADGEWEHGKYGLVQMIAWCFPGYLEL